MNIRAVGRMTEDFLPDPQKDQDLLPVLRYNAPKFFGGKFRREEFGLAVNEALRWFDRASSLLGKHLGCGGEID
jgi:hypothetical protein